MRTELFVLVPLISILLGSVGVPQTAAAGPNPTDRAFDAFEDLEAKLDDGPVELAFDRVPLANAVEVLADRHGLQVFVDHAELADEGFDFEDLIVRVETTTPTLRHAFDLLFDSLTDDLDLTVVNDRGVLALTTEKKSHERHFARVYDTRALLRQATAGEVMEIVQYGTSGPWFDTEGTGAVLRTVGSLLVVRARYELHREIDDLLASLTTYAEESGGIGVPFGSEVPPGALLFEPAPVVGFWGGPSIEVRACCPVVGEFVVTDRAGEITSRHRGRISRLKRPGLGQDEPANGTGGSQAAEPKDGDRS